MLSLVYASLLRVKGISSSISSAVVSMPSRAYASLLPDTPCVLKCGKSSVNALSGLCLIVTAAQSTHNCAAYRVSMPSRAYASLLHTQYSDKYVDKMCVNALSGLCLIVTQKGIRMKIVTRKAVSMPSRAYASLLP